MAVNADTSQAPLKHLWEHGHPYYCEHGNFFSRGLATGYDSWAEFTRPVDYDRTGPQLAQTGTLLHDGDPDRNCLFRWDWRAMHLEYPEDYPDGTELHYLDLFFIMQGKPFNQSVRVTVTPADEPEIRAWLAGRAETMRTMWSPFLG